MRRLLLLMTIVSASCAVLAQNAPRAEIFGGYSYQRASTGIGGAASNTSGWGASLAGYFTQHIGIVADFSGQYATKTGQSFHIYNMDFGPQVAYHGEAAVSPFIRALIGVSNADAGFGTLTASSTDWNYGAGAGVDVNVKSHIAIRVFQFDYIRTHFPNGGGNHQNQARIEFGIVFKAGAK